ncbi:hypothetical protein ACWD46_14445 [Streptomyces sp. NPDC002486]
MRRDGRDVDDVGRTAVRGGIPAAPDQTIVAYTPDAGSETAERLALLGSWATSRTG